MGVQRTIWNFSYSVQLHISKQPCIINFSLFYNHLTNKKKSTDAVSLFFCLTTSHWNVDRDVSTAYC